MTQQTDLHFLTPGGRTPVHQPQDVQTHVVLAAPSQAEAKARGPTIQVHAVVPGVTLGDKRAVSGGVGGGRGSKPHVSTGCHGALTFGRTRGPFLLL